jgi:hypothetical protein
MSRAAETFSHGSILALEITITGDAQYQINGIVAQLNKANINNNI